MRITGTGHASLHLETSAGSILCDPWVNPAYFASWFPFPDNSQLDWQQLGQCDYLYVSHLHRDHFDAKNLAENIRKDTTVLFPDFPTSSMQDELRELGFPVIDTHQTVNSVSAMQQNLKNKQALVDKLVTES